MSKPLNELRLAALQAEQLINLPSKDSRVVACAAAFNRRRKNLKKRLKLGLRRLLRRSPVKTDVLRVLVHIRGGIGDVAMARIFVQKLRAALPQAEIYFCYDSQTVVNVIFQDGGLINGFQNRNYIPEDYDLVIAGCHVLMYDYYDEARIRQLAPDFIPILQKGLEMQKIFKIFADNTPHLDGYLADITVAFGSARIPNMGLSTGLAVGQNDRVPLQLKPEGFAVLDRLGLSGKKYITMHDGINTNTDTSSGYPTRCWPETNWRDFARLFKQHFPEILIVQLGGSKSRVFDFADVSLVGKTSVADLPYILEKAALHVDGESGMVQLANLTTATRSVVAFGPTPVKYFGYARNINVVSEKCTNCMCIVKNWMTHCALNYPLNANCLATVSARTMFEKAAAALEEKL